MDPNETLRLLREWAKDETIRPSESSDVAAELFEALDQWLSNGGFAPRDWKHSE